MSPLFVKEFVSTNKCPKCPASRGGKSLCRRHLTVARLAWRVWSHFRRRRGLCMDCGEPAVPLAGRCETHRKMNAVRSARWHTAHPAESAERNTRRQIERVGLRRSGKCPSCRERAPIFKRGRCETCYKIKIAPTEQVKDALRERRRNRRIREERSEIVGIRQQLRRLGYVVPIGKLDGPGHSIRVAS